MQERIGLQAATDGEFRRRSWHMDFIYQLGGITKTDQQLRVSMHNKTSETSFDTPGMAVDQPGRAEEPIFADDFLFLSDKVSSALPKLTIPSPSMVHYRAGASAVDRDVYPDLDQFWADLSTAYADEVRAVHDLGCRYLQLDDTSLAYLNDPAQRAAMAARGEDADHQHLRTSSRSTRRSPTGRPTCRHHPHVPRQLPLVLGGRGWLRLRRRGALRRARRRRLLLRVRRRALRHVRAPAVRAARQAGGARARHHEVRGAGGRRHAQAPHRRGREARAARAAVPLAAVRLLVDGRGQRAHGRGAVGEAAADRRGRARTCGSEPARARGARRDRAAGGPRRCTPRCWSARARVRCSTWAAGRGSSRGTPPTAGRGSPASTSTGPPSPRPPRWCPRPRS